MVLGQAFNTVRYGNEYSFGGAISTILLTDSSFISCSGFQPNDSVVILRKISKSGVLLDSAYYNFPQALFNVATRWFSLESINENKFLLLIDVFEAPFTPKTKILLLNYDLDTIQSSTFHIPGYLGTYTYDCHYNDTSIVLTGAIEDTVIQKIQLFTARFDTLLNLKGYNEHPDWRPQSGGYIPEMIKRIGKHYYISGRCTYWSKWVESFLVKIDLQGNKIWDKRYRYQQYNCGNSLLMNYGDTIFMTQTYISATVGNQYLVKLRMMELDTSGLILRDTIYPDEEWNYTISDIIKTHSGSMLLSGHFRDDWHGGTYSVLWNINKDFSINYQRAYHYSDPENASYLYRIHQWPDSTLLGTGTFLHDHNNPSNKWAYLWLLGLDKNGCLGTGNCGVFSVPEEPQLGQAGLLVYPNPVQDYVHLQLPNYHGQATLTLYNMVGQVVLQKQVLFTNGTANLPLWQGAGGRIATGMYSIKLKTKHEEFTQKLLVQ